MKSGRHRGKYNVESGMVDGGKCERVNMLRDKGGERERCILDYS
jgi:hypothetical protein